MRRGFAALLLLALSTGVAGQEASPPVATPDAGAASAEPIPATRSGREIYQRFREGLANPDCSESSDRWRRHYAAAPRRLAHGGDDVLPLFGYVVDALREAHLPTEYALIPFVESGYKPGARSRSGPAGMWQFIGVTARKHNVPMRAGYDGRLSPIESTRAAVRYLKTLHGMFAGDWRLAVMAYNAGEYRIFGALRRSGQQARNATPETLPGLSGITHAYVRKLRALSCLLEQADDREEWLQALDRPVPVLEPVLLPAGTTSLDAWSKARGLDPSLVRRLNPAFAGGRVARAGRAMRVLVPVAATASTLVAAQEAAPEALGPTAMPSGPSNDLPATDAIAAAPGTLATASASAAAAPRSHTVSRGDSAWKIARRYGVSVTGLLARNGLDARGRLRPGMVLKIDSSPGE